MIKECKVCIRNGEFNLDVNNKIGSYKSVSYIQYYNYKYDSIITRTEITFEDEDTNDKIKIEHENLVSLILFKPTQDSIDQDMVGLMFELRHNIYDKLKSQLNIQFELKDFKKFNCEYLKTLELQQYQFKPVFNPIELIRITYDS